jgi:CDP-diacylglycerol---serine O-phosphatidyltransferase
VTDLFPPFASDVVSAHAGIPDPLEAKHKRFKPVSMRLMIPNIITLLGLCLGFSAIRFAYEGRLEFAVLAILGAAVLDGLDGRIARLLRGTSRFGAELDSLADFISFGVAPAFLLFTFILYDLKSLGWIVALIFACSAALRLARFNVMLDDPDRPEWKKAFFTGVPTPAAAIAVLLPVHLFLLGGSVQIPLKAALCAVYTTIIALLMVSTLPTFSGKTLGTRIPRTWVLPLFVGAIAFVALLASFTFEVLALLSLVYLLSLPLALFQYGVQDKKFQNQQKQAAEIK